MGEGRSTQTVRLFTDVASRIADPFLARAYSLAEEGRGTTSPNPMVGCVIVAGMFGAATAKGSILFTQALPAVIALAAVLLSRRSPAP